MMMAVMLMMMVMVMVVMMMMTMVMMVMVMVMMMMMLVMFYIASPSATSFPDLKALPKSYVDQAMPYFFIMTLLEWAVLAAKGKMPRLNDGLFSIVHGLIMTLMEYLVKGVLFSAYLYIHANHCLYQLPWDSPLTWVIAAFAIDFCYYWVHRSAHEINVLWAAHQVHHSSEDYNLTTALRQSAFQSMGSWPLYLPLAFFVPPAQAVIHKELNLLYQFWIHTELVESIGPFEWVLNTASHHRVHHGANRYCLDKNYAGVLIIWDRMFGGKLAPCRTGSPSCRLLLRALVGSQAHRGR